jgi:hypothetical protein
MSSRALLLLASSLVLSVTIAAAAAGEVDREALAAVAARAQQRAAAWQGPLAADLRARTTAPTARLLADPAIALVGVSPAGRPICFATENYDAAITVSTNEVWPGGATGLDLDGANLPGDLAVWDAGIARGSHQEFGGRVQVGDGSTSIHDHSTHVAGTLVAQGVVPQAHGMSPAALLRSYRWDDDELEMIDAAADGLRLSNHSYGIIMGWRHGWQDPDAWYWFGDPELSETEDAGFGFYSELTAAWDAIAHAAPGYLIVKSGGNDRNDAGPGPGGGHYVWDPDQNDWVWSTVTRDPDGGQDGYECIGFRGVAKNILTVGAVQDIAGGWSDPADVQVSSFTNWGPTDDGRIKPDLVANGVILYSALGGSDQAYGSYSGTSMSAPNATGSLNLLLQLYRDRLGAEPLASTLKALVLHTASEAGPAPGPDYRHGWGLLNTAAAALLIDAATAGERIFERSIGPGTVDAIRFYHDGGGPLAATIVWTDPAGTPPPWSLDPPDLMLVHDLDLRLVREEDGEVFLPWILDPADPAAPATRGVNVRDNVETVEATGAGAGYYTLEVAHADLGDAEQVYSLVVTGLRREPVLAVTGAVPPARLLRAAPNPFNPRTEITLALPRAGEASLEVFDARGRRVATLHDGPLPAGEQRLAWAGRDGRGRPVAAGIYLVRLRTQETVDHLRVTLVK